MRLDEDAFLAALIAGLPTSDELLIPPGDDCAAIAWGPDEWMLIAVDQVAADVHYHGRQAPDPTPPELAGRKLLARNLSDIAAMGGRPRFALLAIAAAADCSREWADAFASGVNELAVATGTLMIGGDLARGGSDVASLTILGSVAPDRLLRRNAVKAGDRIFVTGSFGGSLASGHHLTFEPRLAEGRWLAGRGIRSGIDVSDGLLKDLERLCHASGVGASLDLEAVPRRCLGGEPVGIAEALLGGEDYELIVSVPEAMAETIVPQWPFATPLTPVGRFVARQDSMTPVHDRHGEELRRRFGTSFNHFA